MELDELLLQLSAIVLEGPKGVGKTATAERRVQTMFRLDDPAQQELARADPSGLLNHPRPMLIDEWQHVPAIWDAVRRDGDVNQTPNQFLLAGSAVGANVPAHSGAGRITTLRMRPMSFAERGLEQATVSLSQLLEGACGPIQGSTSIRAADYAREIVSSGFPRIRMLTGRALRQQLRSYIARVIDRDFPEQGHPVRKPDTLRRWLRAYAAATATTTSMEKIRDAASIGGATPQRPTVEGYREVLNRMWLLDDVPGWASSNNEMTRLVQLPKRHLADPALAAVLLGLDERALLTATPTSPSLIKTGSPFGHLFESLAVLSLRTYAQAADVEVYHARDRDGAHEVDVILEAPDRRVLGVEIKLNSAASEQDVKDLHWFKRQVGVERVLDLVLINTGPHAYRRPDGVAVVPLALLGA